MQNDPIPIEVDPSPNFIRDLRELSKSYRHIKSDLQPLIDQLLQGETPGDRIKGIQSLAKPPGTGIGLQNYTVILEIPLLRSQVRRQHLF